MRMPIPSARAWRGLTLAVALGLAACGGSAANTPTPLPTATTAATATATRATTPTSAPVSAASPTRAGSPAVAAPGTPSRAASPGGSPAANPAAVTGAFANLQKLESYHLEITASGFDKLLPLGLGSSLTISTDYNNGNQHTIVTDNAGFRQEAYKVGGKFYSVDNGQVTEVTSLPLLFNLPDLLYLYLTAPGTTSFTMAGAEQINGRTTTKYQGTGSVARLAANPLLGGALAGASGDIKATVWIDSQGNFLVAGDITVDATAPTPATAKLRMDVTRIGQVGPIQAPR